jgi:MOSC domain-containing protein YiiM
MSMPWSVDAGADRSICAGCGFDARRWSDVDVERTLAHADDLVGYVLDGWTGEPILDLDPEADPAAGAEVDGDAAIVAVHGLMHRLHDLAARRRVGDRFEPMIGSVRALHASRGGVPKLPIPSADIDASGVVGDRQGNRRHHGRPWQAVCLYSAERLDALADEGHPIGPGAIGENITVAGVDWSRLRGGLTIEIGDLRLLTSSPAAPCQKIGGCFVDRDWNRIDHDRRPGWARWYASVLVGASVRPGDRVVVRA